MDKPYMAVALDVNFKNPEQRQAWYIYNKAEEVDSASTLWLYDGYYVRTQYSITLEQIRSENKLEEIKSWDGPSDWNFVLFKKRASSAPTP